MAHQDKTIKIDLKKIIVLLAVLLALCPMLNAQTKPGKAITIEALVVQALANNAELRFYESEIAAAKGMKRTAGSWQNPEIAGELGAKRTVGDGIDATGIVWATSIQQTFEWPGRVSLRKHIANRQVKLAEQGLEQFRSTLAATVRQKAYEVLVAQQKQKAAADVASRAEELVSMLVQRESSGVAPVLEIRVIEAAILKLRRAESETAKQLHTAQLDLNQFCGRALSESVTISETKMAFPALPPVSELLRRAITGNFELLQRRMELEQQGFKVRLAKNDVWPSITTGPVIEQEYAGDQETRATFAVSLPVPLWNQNKGGIEVAKARQLQAQNSLLITQREVERRIREAAHTYELYRKEIARWNPKASEELREAAQLADRHYRLGAVPLSTYLETQSSYLEALDVLCATQADALQAFIEIEKLTGSKIK